MRPDNTYYLFDFPLKLRANGDNDVYWVLFWVNESIETTRLLDTLKEYLKNNFAATKLLVLTAQYNMKHLKDVQDYLQTDLLSSSLFFLDDKKHISYLYFNEFGKIFDFDSHKPWKKTAIYSALTQKGLFNIFDKRGGILTSSTTSHYQYPSGKHAKKFIRTGNILTIGSEVNFMAFCLLPYFKLEISEIVCDTSTIISVAQALVNLRRCLNHNCKSPNINSFGSYEGLDAYYFEDASNSLVLISASTSGNLAKKVQTKEFTFLDADNIITLYYLSSIDKNNQLVNWNNVGKVLCYLDFHKDTNPLGYEPIKFYKNGEDCDYCGQGNSLPLKIIGDQFLPEKINVRTITIGTAESPKWLDGFAKEFSMNQVLICQRRKRDDDNDEVEKRELFIDLELIHKKAGKYLRNPEQLTSKIIFHNYIKRYYKILEQNIPASLRKIIYLNDDASEVMGHQIEAYYNQFSKVVDNDLLLRYQDNLNVYETIKDIKTGTILVVGSSVSTSRKLLNISRLLRNNDQVSIIYIVGVMRTYTEKDFEDIRINICYGNLFGVNTHALRVVQKIHIPDDQHLKNGTSWDQEERFLNKLLELNYEEISTIKEYIEVRCKRIKESKNGLITDVFLNTPDDNFMSLRKGFAFFNFNYNRKKVSQADVYFTISSIIHHLRTEKVKGDFQLDQHEHQVNLLDPHNFDRLNDGVIQSAILRAALPEELNYSVDDKISGQMTDIILTIVKNRRESTYEFLLAITTNKLKLTVSDIRKINSSLITTSNNDLNALSQTWYKVFSLYIEQHFLNE